MPYKKNLHGNRGLCFEARKIACQILREPFQRIFLVLDGIFQRGCKVRITREGEQIFEGELASLKRFKDDVKEVKAGFECGLVFDGFDKMQEYDIVEAYTMVEVPR